MLDLQADATGPAEAVILDTCVEKGLGPVADVLVNWGTLKVGDHVVCGREHGRVRRLIKESDEKSKAAADAGVGPSEVCAHDPSFVTV